KKSKPINFSIFIPHTMTFVVLTARPLGSQVVPIKDANYDCARYDVRTLSTQSDEGLQARQEMWFDKRSSLMMKLQDTEPGLAPGEAPVTERASLAELALVRPLVMRPPELPHKTFPYGLGLDLVYTVRIGTEELGRVSVCFEHAAGGAGEPFVARAKVNLGGRGTVRHETAVTYFDRDWRPVSYLAEGDETTDVKASYKVEARLNQGQVEVSLYSKPELAAAAAPAPKAAAPEATPEDGGWQDPLKRVPISDEDAKAAEAPPVVPRPRTRTFARELSGGTFFYDFNRLEHLAALAYRFPLPGVGQASPPVPGRPVEAGQAGTPVLPPPFVSQKAALFLLRQNRSDVVRFDIQPERGPALTARQQRRLKAANLEVPQLYVANTDSALLPCRMLLAPDGRILELVLKHGNQEVVYTLDDPIMRRRAERAQKQKLQEGPQLIRPPWW
ncbi:MAG: hypothetical protein ABSE73_23345, partial [Planctomycetota bacterium]